MYDVFLSCTSTDVKIAERLSDYLKYYNIPVTIVCTKLDKVSKNNHDKNKRLVMKELKLDSDENIILFSSITKNGKNEIYNEIGKYLN